ncbi:23S rRNA (pseudouridine(1915)-N(3))-methyltransferase RlmH [Leucobacter sp. CSA2]|uniref:Ribosomal RNA large subunit methyltransferase H n=1 Tax=Leucobacter edaphi TaxID=2796472 RepID=A0A934UY95_9MICO|nr:23S rRNA (pseudouridine(1915)-N(3))-methyltransferase RlmH [Leucobacter edaphi]MBK0421847.1 23S rRNA (pseudouridine(1915)-N(3))-methyltransferase RlmH [Leucobacter edaphi]
MSVRIFAVGKKHESWVSEGIGRYEKRLRKPFDASWQLLSHSSRNGEAARAEESERILAKLGRDEFVLLLDERGRNVDSLALAATLRGAFDAGRSVTVLIGGAFGVDDRVRSRADFVWSLSKLVFPHQLVRLILAEQLYRAQEIAAGRPYHHV